MSDGPASPSRGSASRRCADSRSVHGGLVAAAMSLVIPYWIGNGLFVMIYACRSVGVPIPRYIRLVFLPPLAWAVPLAARRSWPSASCSRTLPPAALAVGLIVSIGRPGADLLVPGASASSCARSAGQAPGSRGRGTDDRWPAVEDAPPSTRRSGWRMTRARRRPINRPVVDSLSLQVGDGDLQRSR